MDWTYAGFSPVTLFFSLSGQLACFHYSFHFTRAEMQKEAIMQIGPDGAVGRVVCNEGAWLNGINLGHFR